MKAALACSAALNGTALLVSDFFSGSFLLRAFSASTSVRRVSNGYRIGKIARINVGFRSPVKCRHPPEISLYPRKVRGQHYDVVVNGWELGGGSIRIHQPDVQKTVFEEVLQIPPDMVKARFGYLLEAFRYGAIRPRLSVCP